MGLFGDSGIVKFKGQDYSSLRKKYTDSKDLFEDPLFPANDYSLNLSKPLPGTVVWKRPPEICERPKLFVEKASSKDVTQGSLGNCWFVAASSALATVKDLWSQVIPEYKVQEWDPVKPENYGGIFHFRFWRFGVWTDVVIDDKLPTINQQLVFCHSTTDNEFWSALMEKAYAKLCGSYGAMDGGNLADALVDFTSGLSEMILLQEGAYHDEEKKNQLRKQMLREHEEHALMCCAIAATDSSLFESRTTSGLVRGHAYGITSIREIHVGNTSLLNFFKSAEKITLLRLRNPWGAKEWNGAFSDGIYSASAPVENTNASGEKLSAGTWAQTSRHSTTNSPKDHNFAYTPEQLLNINSRSPEWTKISKSEKEKLGLTFEDDGEFWIPFDDFISEFTDLSICHLINTSLFTFRKSWVECCLEGQWTLPNNAGGCPNNDTFLSNPQYCLDVPKNNMELIVQLLQTDQRGKSESNPSAVNRTVYRSIGFHIMRVEDNRQHRTRRQGKKAVTSDYVKGRSVYFQGTLDKGRYILLPTTFDANIETEFYLRTYAEDKIYLRELKTEHPEPFWMFASCFPPPECVTIITVEGASGLAKADNTYCVISVEGQHLKSDVVSNSVAPIWNVTGVFFRTNVCKPIFVELWGKRFIRDQFLGVAVIVETADNTSSTLTSQLVGRGRKASERRPGEVKSVVVTYDDLKRS